MAERKSDGINFGRPHPNRPLPAFEFSLGSDLETRQRNPAALVAATEGIYDVITLMGREPAFNNHLIGQEEALSDVLEAFRQRNPNSGLEQINVVDFIHHLAREGALDQERPLYFLTSKDLFEPRLHFMFGATMIGLGISVQSTKRFEEASRNTWWLQETSRLMARHEFGHLVGLNESTIVNRDPRPGIYRSHCTNICTMRQVMSVRDVYELIQQLDGAPNAGFCDDCVQSLQVLGSH